MPVLAGGLLLAGCGGSGTPGGPSSSAVSQGEMEGEVLRIAALPKAEREMALAAAGSRIWDGLMAHSGMSEALVEDELADLDRAVARLVGQVASTRDELDSAQDGAGRQDEEADRDGESSRAARASRGQRSNPGAVAAGGRAADGPKLPSGGALVGGFGELRAVAGGLPALTDQDAPVRAPFADGEATISGDRGKGVFESSRDLREGDVRLQMDNRLEVVACPDPDGRFTASGSVDAKVSSADSRSGGRAEVAFTMAGQVDDDARLVSVDAQTRLQMADYLPDSGFSAFLDVTVGSRFTDFGAESPQPGQGVRTKTVVNRTGGKGVDSALTQAYTDLAGTVGASLSIEVADAARKGWESGRCVTLEPATQPQGTTGLKPSATVTVTADPRSRIDGQPVGGTVVAQLASGGDSVAPAGEKVPAVAVFTYTAPAEKDASGRVELEARSKRGVATAGLSFDTKAASSYTINETLPSVPAGITLKGRACSLSKPFTVQASGDVIGPIKFRPTSETGGRWSFKGKVGNAPLTVVGSGRYKVAGDPSGGTGTLDFTFTLTIKIPVVGDQTNGGPASLRLTPTTACSE